jgi:hypothetical protein
VPQRDRSGSGNLSGPAHRSINWEGSWRLTSSTKAKCSTRSRFRGREITTTGDGFLATLDGPGRAVRCARVIRDAVRAIGIHVRVGIHTGEIELRGDDIGGIAVHITQRVQAHAQPDEVLVSRQSSTSSAARASRSLIAASMRSTASPTNGDSSPSKTHLWDLTPRANSSANSPTRRRAELPPDHADDQMSSLQPQESVGSLIFCESPEDQSTNNDGHD